MTGFSWGGRPVPRWRRYALRARGLGEGNVPATAPAGDYVTIDWGERRRTEAEPILAWWVSRSVSGPGSAQEHAGGRAENATHAVNWLHSHVTWLKLRPGHPASLFFDALDEAAVRLDYARRLTADCTGISITVTEGGVATTLSIGCTVETDGAALLGTPAVTLSRCSV
ncbi:hypothetical protein [Streptomyces rimosus]|uniref:hypothetical protein n=1 Tax=Streptomyces rimosus TaxID=1927 RepID=UPI0004BEAEE1|nr:hypothetical protein [Streptomyces rimosus]